MKYVHTSWKSDIPDQPIDIYGEIDDARWEIRKIEKFKDGTYGIASGSFEDNGTILAEVPYPSLEDINRDDQFFARYITQEEFDKEWSKAVSGRIAS